MSPQQPSPKILVIAEGQIGDLLLLTPLFRAVKESYPSSALCLLAVERRQQSTGQSELIAKSEDHFLAGMPYLSSVFVLRRDLLRSLKGIARLRAEWRSVRFLRRERFDTIISAFPDDRFALWAWLSGARHKVGEAHKGLGWTYTRSPVRRKGEGSILDYFCELAELAGCRVRSKATEYTPSAKEEEWARSFIENSGLQPGGFVLVHPGATGDYKIWPPDRYRLLFQELVKRSGFPVLLCGGPLDKELVAGIAGEPPNSIAKIHIESVVGRFASLVKRAALLISNDSGPRHIAVAVGTPSLAIFRRFHDSEWGAYGESEVIRIVQSREACPLCPVDSCQDRIPADQSYGSCCLHSIHNQEVVDVALQMLRQRSVQR